MVIMIIIALYHYEVDISFHLNFDNCLLNYQVLHPRRQWNLLFMVTAARI